MTELGYWFIGIIIFWIALCIFGAWMNNWKPIKFEPSKSSWEMDGHP